MSRLVHNTAPQLCYPSRNRWERHGPSRSGEEQQTFDHLLKHCGEANGSCVEAELEAMNCGFPEITLTMEPGCCVSQRGLVGWPGELVNDYADGHDCMMPLYKQHIDL